MKTFCFTIDDNIRFLKEITEQNPNSIFEHPYLAMLRRLHEKFNVKIQLNLFYRLGEFNLSQMSDRYQNEWSAVSSWLKLSFHSDFENVYPYENSGYEEVYRDCRAVNEQILRFASENSLAKTTTVHCCKASNEGLFALRDNGVSGLLGLFGSNKNPRNSYGISGEAETKVRNGELIVLDGMTFASIDMIVNTVKLENIFSELTKFLARDSIRIMIHEQYFYKDYKSYQPDFEEKLSAVFEILCANNYKSCFFEELIKHV